MEISINAILSTTNIPEYMKMHKLQDLFMEDWPSRHNHSENKGKEITDMHLGINAIQSTSNIPECMKMHKLQEAMSQD